MRLLIIAFCAFFTHAGCTIAANIEIAVKEAAAGGHVRVDVLNHFEHPVGLWKNNSGMSWGWGDWTFEFFDGNALIICVRKPTEAFSVNFPVCYTIPANGVMHLDFNLGDGTWVSERVGIWPAYADKLTKKWAIRGCFAVLAVPESDEAKQYSVWTGMTTSPLLRTDSR